MNKKLVLIISAVVGIFVLGFGIYQSDASEADPKLTIDDASQMVTDQYPGTITEIELDKENNKDVYEVKTVSNGVQYKIYLDANTGEILTIKDKTLNNKEEMNLQNSDVEKNNSKEKGAKSKPFNKHHNKSNKENKNNCPDCPLSENKNKDSTYETLIDAKKAINIAQNEFIGIVTELELEKDDGKLIYEVKIKDGKEEAEIEIDAYTGEVLVIEIETKN